MAGGGWERRGGSERVFGFRDKLQEFVYESIYRLYFVCIFHSVRSFPVEAQACSPGESMLSQMQHYPVPLSPYLVLFILLCNICYEQHVSRGALLKLSCSQDRSCFTGDFTYVELRTLAFSKSDLQSMSVF